MLEDLDYSNFTKYLKSQLEDSSHHEVNGIEVFIDYYNDYPPNDLNISDSDFFREEIDRLVQDQIFHVERTLIEKESAWLTVDGDKWRLCASDIDQNDDRTDLFKLLNLDDEALINLSILEIDAAKRKSLASLYKQKVKEYGSNQEKYDVIKLIVDSYIYTVDEKEDYSQHMITAGKIGYQLARKGSFKYFEFAAKYFRSKYEHEDSAIQFKSAIDAAKLCDEEKTVILSLTKSMRIQYELCRDEEKAAEAFIDENNLIAKIDGRKTTKLVFGILRHCSDYCQNPSKVFIGAFILIIFSAIMYATSGIASASTGVQSLFTSEINIFRVLWDSLYFSIVTFTTLGYGDFYPCNDFSRFIANVEALGGVFFTSLFLVTLVRKYGR
ncbi:MAG: hypothetical protein ACJAV1_001376 [Paraglaciecola sp.]|jgi:hypothetical protein